MNTATDDGLTRSNPCRIKGASVEKSPERPVLAIRDVLALAEVIALPYRALVLLAVFGSLRWGELAGLQRNDIDLDAQTIPIERQLAEQPGGGFAVAPPKSDAGKGTVVIPQAIAPITRQHMQTYVAPGPHSLVFTSAAGQPLRHANFRTRVWLPAFARLVSR